MSVTTTTTTNTAVAASKKNKGGIVFGTGGGAKERTGAPKTPPLNNMNHVPIENPQNDNEVEEMETQEGELVFLLVRLPTCTAHRNCLFKQYQ